MEKEVLENYKKAKEISDKVIEFSKSLVKENAKILDIAEKIEEKIRELKGKPAWPVNISINEIAAHYTPDINDTIVLKIGDLAKIDIGIQVNGYIWDRAYTVCIGRKTHLLIEASEKALEEALKVLKSDVKICEVSEVVENTVTTFAVNPIRNLCGHRLEQYEQHAHPSIPNGKNKIQERLEEGWAVAMEVFTTNGSGWVKESEPCLIYKYKQNKPVRLWEARKILELSKNKFERLPFTKRWLEFSPIKIDIALRQLSDVGAIQSFPPLKEETDGLVAVAEETVLL